MSGRDRCATVVEYGRVSESRRAPRHKVHLSVRYSTAREFVREYAENLSKSGLFIKGAYALAPLQLVAVRIELPGFGQYEILAEVVHIVSPEQSVEYNRPAGAGLAIVGSPPEFPQSLEGYLQRLGQRKDHLVLIADEPAGILLSSCGYRVKRAPAPGDVREMVRDADRPIIGIIVPGAQVKDYRRILSGMVEPHVVYDMESLADIDEILAWLDDNLMHRLDASKSP